MRKFSTLLLVLLIFSARAFAQYCTPGYQIGTLGGDHISNVTLGMINNNTGPSGSGYIDYTNLSTDLFVGSSNTLMVTSGQGSSQSIVAWIDFDHNFQFDTYELLGFQAAPPGVPLSFPFTVPTGAALGFTRMRVLMANNIAPTPNPCGFFYIRGEAEDYSVNILAASGGDLAISAITTPAGGCNLGSAEMICATISNLGTTSQSAIPVGYRINGGPAVSETAAITIAPGGTGNFCFTTPANLSTPGPYTLQVWTAATGDLVPSNDTLTFNFISSPGVSTFPYFENFESGMGGWTAGGTASTWELGTPQGNVINVAGSGVNCWINGNNVSTAGGQYNNNEASWVQSPCFDLSGLSNPVIRMKIWWETEFTQDGAALQFSTNGGTSWAHVGAFGDPGNWYNDNTIPGLNFTMNQEGWSGRNQTGNGSGGWLTAEHPITSLAGQADVRFRIAFGANGSVPWEGFAFDDVQILEPTPFDAALISLDQPLSGCSLSASETMEITYSNVGTSAFSSINFSYSINGGPAVTETSTATVSPGSSQSYSFTTPANFSATGVYAINVWCTLAGDPISGNDTLANLSVSHFNPISAFPYFQNFDLNGAMPAGWYNALYDDAQDWILNQGATGSAGTGPSADHTTGSGWYPYLEDSGEENDSVILVSPCFDISGLANPELRFWYHSNNAGAPAAENTLHVDLEYQGNWIYDIVPPIGDSTNSWVLQTASLLAYPGVIAVRFRGDNNNNNFTHDIAIDDFLITELLPQDAGVLSILAPGTGCDLSSAETVDILLANLGTDTLFGGFNASFSVNGGAIVTEPVSATLLPGDTLPYSFTGTADLSVAGPYALAAWTSGLIGDTNLGNDSAFASVEHRNPVTAYPWTEDFENGGLIPAGWINENWDGLQNWIFSTGPTTIGGTGPSADHTSGSGYFAYVSDASGLNNDSVVLTTPCFDLSGLSNPAFSFWFHSNATNSGINPATYNYLHLDIYYQGAWINDIIPSITHKDNLWNLKTVNLIPYSGSTVAFRFRVNNNNLANAHEIAIDDINVYDVPQRDGALTGFVNPKTKCSMGLEDVSILVSNFGYDTIFSFQANYAVDGGIPVTEMVSLQINPLDTVLYSFVTLADLSTTGMHTLNAWVSGITGDTNAANDSLIGYTVENLAEITTFPYFQDFESGTNGWIAGGANSTWEFGTPILGTINNAASGSNCWVTGNGTTNAGGTYNAGEFSFVQSPCLDLSALNLPQVRLKVWWESEFSYDGAALQVSSDGGASWTHVGMVGDPDNWYNDGTVNGLFPSGSQDGWTGRSATGDGSGGWLSAKHALTGFGGTSVLLRILFASDNFIQDEGFAFDDFEIFNLPPDDLGVSALLSPENQICGDSATEVWVIVNNYGSEAQWNYSVQATLSGAGSGMISTVVPDTLYPLGSDTILLGTFNSVSGGIYQITAFTSLPGDSDLNNDTLLIGSLNINPIPAAPTALDVFGCEPDTFVLSVSSPVPTTTYNWYDVASGGTILGTGASFTTPVITANTSFYIEAIEAQMTTGGKPDISGPGSLILSSQFNQGLLFNVFQPVVLDTVTVYPGTSGLVTINLRNSSGTIINTATVNVTLAVPGAATKIPLGFPISPGFAYRIDAAGSSVVTLFRNTGGVSYPIISGGGSVEIINTINGQGATDGYYFFFYDWKLTEKGCPSPRSEVEAVLFPTLNVDLGPDAFTCAGVILDATTAGAVSYLWNTGQTTSAISVGTSGSYSVTVTDTNSCPATDTINMTILPSPVVDLGGDATVCGITTLDAGNSGSLYSWSNGMTTQQISVSSSGTYSVSVTSPSGCVGGDTVTITVNQNPVVDLGPDLFECDSVILDAGNPGATYSWSTGETTQQLSVTTTGLYEVSITDASGCTGSDQVFITILEGPAASFTAMNSSGSTVQFTDASTGSTPLNFSWDFGDGNTSTMQNPSYTYATGGTYTVSLTSCNSCGCDTTTQLVMAGSSAIGQAFPGADIRIFPNPNSGAFTLSAEGLFADALQLSLLDVNGRRVFHTETGKVSGDLNLEVQAGRLTAGIYLLVLQSESGLYSQKIVVE